MSFDFKSLLIGFLLASCVFLTIAAIENDDGRYMVSASENGVCLMDTRTGIIKIPRGDKVVTFSFVDESLTTKKR